MEINLNLPTFLQGDMYWTPDTKLGWVQKDNGTIALTPEDFHPKPSLKALLQQHIDDIDLSLKNGDIMSIRETLDAVEEILDAN